MLALALAGVLAGCAVTEDTVSVPYKISSATPIAGAETIRVTVTAADARTTNRGRISTKINGYGMEMAAIRSNEDVADVVKAALSDELKARGYSLVQGGVRINAAVDTFYNEFKVGILAGHALGEVKLTVTVVDTNGRQRFERQFTGHGDKTVQLASGSNAAASLSEALGHALNALLADPDFVHALADG